MSSRSSLISHAHAHRFRRFTRSLTAIKRKARDESGSLHLHLRRTSTGYPRGCQPSAPKQNPPWSESTSKGPWHAYLWLVEDGNQTGKQFVHDVLGDGIKTLPRPGSDVEGARLVAAKHAGRSSACSLLRYCGATPVCDAPARGDGQDHGRAGQFVERRRGSDQYRPGSLLFMAGSGIKVDKSGMAPVRPVRYDSSLPHGMS